MIRQNYSIDYIDINGPKFLFITYNQKMALDVFTDVNFENLEMGFSYYSS